MSQYFKMVQDNQIIDISDGKYLRWQERHKMLLYCEANQAEYLQSSVDDARFYHAPWMTPLNDKAEVVCESADIYEIDEAEYENLKSLLEDGEEITKVEETNDEAVLEEPIEEMVNEEPEPQKPSTLMELRQIIADQAKQIQMLQESVEELRNQTN